MNDPKADPPRIDDLGILQGVIQMNLGNMTTIYEQEWLDDGTVVAYIGVGRIANIPGDEYDIRQLIYGPVGAAYAVPDGETEDGKTIYRVDIPDSDAVNRAIRTRMELENDHLARRFNDIEARIRDRHDYFVDEIEGEFPEFNDADSISELDLSPSEAFELGRHVGSKNELSGLTRAIARQKERPISGDRRWDSPEYEVIRNRRASSPLETE